MDTVEHYTVEDGSDDKHYFLDIDMAVFGRPEAGKSADFPHLMSSVAYNLYYNNSYLYFFQNLFKTI